MKSRKLISTITCAFFICVALKVPNTSAQSTPNPSAPPSGIATTAIPLSLPDPLPRFYFPTISLHYTLDYIQFRHTDNSAGAIEFMGFYVHDSDEVYDRFVADSSTIAFRNEMTPMIYNDNPYLPQPNGVFSGNFSTDFDYEFSNDPQDGIIYYIFQFQDEPIFVGKIDYRHCFSRAQGDFTKFDCRLNPETLRYDAYRNGILLDSPTDDNPTDDDPTDDNPTDDNLTDKDPADDQPTDDKPTDDNPGDNKPNIPIPGDPTESTPTVPKKPIQNSIQATPPANLATATVVKNTETDNDETLAPIATTDGDQNLPPNATTPLQNPASTSTARTYSWWALWPLLSLLLASAAYLVYRRVYRSRAVLVISE